MFFDSALMLTDVEIFLLFCKKGKNNAFIEKKKKTLIAVCVSAGDVAFNNIITVHVSYIE